MKLWGHRQKKREVVYKDAMSSFLFAIFAISLAILVLNLAMLFPAQLTTLFYMMELMILQHFNYPVYLQRWELYILMIFAAVFGYNLLPILHAPSEGMSRVYFYSWVEGDTRFFRTLGGYVQVNKDFVDRSRMGARWTVVGDVSTYYEGNVLVLQTKEMEVTKSNIWKRTALAYAKYVADLEDAMKNGPDLMSTEEMKGILRAMKGGGGDEK